MTTLPLALNGPLPVPVPYNFKKPAGLTFNEVRRALIGAGLLLRKLF